MSVTTYFSLPNTLYIVERIERVNFSNFLKQTKLFRWNDSPEIYVCLNRLQRFYKICIYTYRKQHYLRRCRNGQDQRKQIQFYVRQVVMHLCLYVGN